MSHECDNLNTHTKGAFYEALAPELARSYIKRFTFCYTPQHGSWLHVAECELSCLTSQCLHDRRIGELTELQTAIALWSEKTNASQRGVDWQCRIENARVKLKRLYPNLAKTCCQGGHSPGPMPPHVPLTAASRPT